jgi:hypothetical protein
MAIYNAIQHALPYHPTFCDNIYDLLGDVYNYQENMEVS